MRNPLDLLWAWAGRHLPWINRAGSEDSLTHLHHALVCALLAGLGAVVGGLTGYYNPHTAFCWTWLAVWLTYLARETAQHGRGRWGYDAVGDVLVPLCWALPALVGGVRAVLGLTLASVVLVLYYIVYRPAAE